MLPIGEVAPLVRRPVQIDLSEQYPELGIRSFGKGTFHKPAIGGAELGTKKIFEIRENDLLFNIVFAWEGAVAVAQTKDDGRVGSHRFLTCLPKQNLATSTFLCFHFLTEKGLEQLLAASPGSAGRNRTLGIKALENLFVPLPPIEKQMWFTSLANKLQIMNPIHQQINTELNALLPSILDKAFKGEL
jgi:type I restriction enzyme S subunit